MGADNHPTTQVGKYANKVEGRPVWAVKDRADSWHTHIVALFTNKEAAEDFAERKEYYKVSKRRVHKTPQEWDDYQAERKAELTDD